MNNLIRIATGMLLVMLTSQCVPADGPQSAPAVEQGSSQLLGQTMGGSRILSDRDPTLALNAYGGAHDGGDVKLWSNCPTNNPDCLWIYRQGMLLSARNPNLAIRGSATNIGSLSLSSSCTPTNLDCTWVWSKGLLYSGRGNAFMINAYGGATHLGALVVNSACAEDNPDCTWTIESTPVTSGWESIYGIAPPRVSNGSSLFLYSNCSAGSTNRCAWQFHRGMMQSAGNTSLAVIVYGLSVGSPVALSNQCSASDSRCQWMLKNGEILSEVDTSYALNAYGGAGSLTQLKMHNGCTASNPDCVFEEGWSTVTSVHYPQQVSTRGAETSVAFSYASTADEVQIVDYNDGNGAPPYNIFGYSVFTPATGWQSYKAQPIAGFPQLRSDPAASGNPYNPNFMYAYQMATSDDAGAYADLIDSFCVARWSDRGMTNPPPLECHKSDDSPVGTGVPSTGIDGAAMAVSPTTGMAVVGYSNEGAQPLAQADLWYTCNSANFTDCGPDRPFRKGTGKLVPFPNLACPGHPRMAFDPVGNLHIMEEVGGGALMYNRLIPSRTNPAFLTPITITSTRDQGPSFVVPATGVEVEDRFYSLAAGLSETGASQARIAYSEYVNGHHHIRFAICTVIACASVPTWDTGNIGDGNHDEIRPVVSYANGSWKVAYLSTMANPGHLTVMYQNLPGTGTTQYPFVQDTARVAPGSPQLADCASGDYNDMKYSPATNQFIYSYSLAPWNANCSLNGVYEAAIPATSR